MTLKLTNFDVTANKEGKKKFLFIFLPILLFQMVRKYLRISVIVLAKGLQLD